VGNGGSALQSLLLLSKTAAVSNSKLLSLAGVTHPVGPGDPVGPGRAGICTGPVIVRDGDDGPVEHPEDITLRTSF